MCETLSFIFIAWFFLEPKIRFQRHLTEGTVAGNIKQ